MKTKKPVITAYHNLSENVCHEKICSVVLYIMLSQQTLFILTYINIYDDGFDDWVQIVTHKLRECLFTHFWL